MQNFNRYLRGFLGMVDAKVGGVAPSTYEDAVRVGIDSWPFLYAQKRELVWGDCGTTASPGFQSGTAQVLVPQDEIWIVEWATAACPLGIPVGESLIISPAVQIRIAGFLTRELLIGNQGVDFGATDDKIPMTTTERRYVGLPNDQFGIFVNRTIGGTTPGLLLSMLIVRIPV